MMDGWMVRLTVKEQRVVRTRVAHEPRHRVKDVLPCRLRACVGAVVRQDNDVFGFIPRSSCRSLKFS
jgi:hypothetical protein